MGFSTYISTPGCVSYIEILKVTFFWMHYYSMDLLSRTVTAFSPGYFRILVVHHEWHRQEHHRDHLLPLPLLHLPHCSIIKGTILSNNIINV